MTDSGSRPLTDEEEAGLRHSFRFDRPNRDDIVQRLLATLDRDRIDAHDAGFKAAVQQGYGGSAASERIAALEGALREAHGVIVGSGNGVTTRSRPIEEWQRLDRLIRAALLATTPPTAVEPEPLPDGACGVMGLCEEPKGHEGPHYTSVERAARLPDPRDPSLAASSGPAKEPLYVPGLADALLDAGATFPVPLFGSNRDALIGAIYAALAALSEPVR